MSERVRGSERAVLEGVRESERGSVRGSEGAVLEGVRDSERGV